MQFGFFLLMQKCFEIHALFSHNIHLPVKFFVCFFQLFERWRNREGKFPPTGLFSKRTQQPGPGWVRARRQELNPGLPCGCRNPVTWAIRAASRASSAGSWALGGNPSSVIKDSSQISTRMPTPWDPLEEPTPHTHTHTRPLSMCLLRSNCNS